MGKEGVLPVPEINGSFFERYSVQNRPNITRYDDVESLFSAYLVEHGVMDLFRSRKHVVFLDLFSGKGMLPLYCIQMLAKQGSLTPQHSIEIHTITIMETPDYDNTNIEHIISGHFFERPPGDRDEYEKNNTVFSDGILGTDILSKITVQHYNGDVLEIIQTIPNNFATVMTAFSCSECFERPLYYSRDYKEGHQAILQAQAIRDAHFARVIEPGGFLLQIAGPGYIPDLVPLEAVPSGVLLSKKVI